VRLRVLAIFFLLVIAFGVAAAANVTHVMPVPFNGHNKSQSYNAMHGAMNQNFTGAHGYGGQGTSAAHGLPNAGMPMMHNISGNGISAQAHSIIGMRKNGSMTFPQGMLIRIFARNHSMSVDGAMRALNETISADLTVNGRSRGLRFDPDADSVNITEGNVTVETGDDISIENDTLSIDGAKVLVMPSEVPQDINAKNIRSAVLHVVSGGPVYDVNATRKAKLLWMFDSDMDVETTLDAGTGRIMSENRPWWSFLASVAGGE